MISQFSLKFDYFQLWFLNNVLNNVNKLEIEF